MIGIKAHPAGDSIDAETAALPYHDLATSGGSPRGSGPDPRSPRERLRGRPRADALAKPTAGWCRSGFKMLFSRNYRHPVVLLSDSVA